jgi:hypothetical protein
MLIFFTYICHSFYTHNQLFPNICFFLMLNKFSFVYACLINDFFSRLSSLRRYTDIRCAFQISSYPSQMYLFDPNISHSGTHFAISYILLFIHLP